MWPASGWAWSADFGPDISLLLSVLLVGGAVLEALVVQLLSRVGDFPRPANRKLPPPFFPELNGNSRCFHAWWMLRTQPEIVEGGE